MKYLKKLSQLLAFSLAVLFISCSSDRPTGQTEAEVLYQEAINLVEDERYILATEKLNLIRSKFPYSFYATHAELLQADIYFAQESFVEAAAAYMLFSDFHPKYKKADYVTFKIAESFYQQLPETFDRDLSPGLQAIEYFQKLLKEYPGSPLAEGSRSKIEQIRNMLDKKERYIADFYFKTDVFDAARFRYLTIVEGNKRDKKLREHSVKRVLLASVELGEWKECLKYYQKYESDFREIRDELKATASLCQGRLGDK